MKKKAIFAGVVAAVLILGGFYYMSMPEPVVPEFSQDNCQENFRSIDPNSKTIIAHYFGGGFGYTMDVDILSDRTMRIKEETYEGNNTHSEKLSAESFSALVEDLCALGDTPIEEAGHVLDSGNILTVHLFAAPVEHRFNSTNYEVAGTGEPLKRIRTTLWGLHSNSSNE